MILNHSRLAATAGPTNPCRLLTGHFSKPFFLLLATCWLLAGGLFAQTNWDGSESTDWFDADNWSAGVPDAADDVTIPGGMPNQPSIGAAALARSVNVLESGSLTILASGSLSINSDASPLFTNNGTVVNEGTFSLNTTTIFTHHRLLNKATGSFTNKNEMHIGNTSGSNYAVRSIFNQGVFVNMAGSIDISSTNRSIYTQTGSTFTNNASIVCNTGLNYGDSSAVTVAGGIFNNTPCSASLVATAGNSYLSRFETYFGGTFNNDGLITANSSSSNNISNNAGIVQNLGGGSFMVASGNAPITDPAPQNPCCLVTGAIWYVNASAAPGGTGAAWDCAFNDLQLALAAASSGHQIWVAEGTYKPTSGTNRTISFNMKEGVEILGGFPNTGDPGLGDRDWGANETILSGEIGAAGLTDNSVNIIANNDVNSTAVLDGFQVSFGSGLSGGDTFGGGLFNFFNASPTVRNCTFSSNHAVYGGGVYNFQNCFPTFMNCAFIGNQSSIFGVACHSYGNSVATFINCSFSGNTGGHGIIYGDSPQVLKNCIIWGNGTQAIAGAASITNSIIEGGHVGSGNLNLDPLFVFQPPVGLGTAGDLRLQACSPAIDAGNDADNSTSLDLGGLPRQHEGISGGQMIDMGAFENQENAPMPVADCQNFTAYLDANGSVTVAGSDISDDSSSPCGAATLSINSQPSLSFNCSDIGQHTVTLTVYSAQSNRSATCQATVTVLEQIKPTLANCPGNILLKTSDDGGADCAVTLTYTAPTFSDNCDGTGTATLLSGPASGTSLNASGSPYTVVYTKTDASGNTVLTNCSFTVTVQDNIAPSITCPANIARNTDAGQCTAVTTYSVTASDNCAYTLTRTSPAGTASGSSFPAGTTNVAWSVTDAGGNATSCAFTITVTDGQLPSIICPANLVRSTGAGLCTAIVSYTTPTYSDNCAGGGVAIVSPSLPSGSAFPKGVNMVSWKASDEAGNTAICQFTVTVNDTQLPSIACPTNQTRSTDANACTASVTYATPTATDNCALSAGQPIWVSGGTSPTPSGSNSVAVFQKGQTTVTWRATDAVGLSKTCTFRVTVNDTQAPTIACPGSQSLNTDVGLCSAVATYDPPTASDNCTPPPTVVRISGLPSGSSFPAGMTTCVWRATDGAGLTKTCSFSITVTDAQLPTITCPQNISVTGSGSPCTATVAYANPTGTDNCAVQSLFLLSGLASGSSFPAGTTTCAWRAVDNSGGSATCAFTVTVSCGTRSSELEVRSWKLESGMGVEGGKTDLRLAPNPATTEAQISMEGLGKSGGELTVVDAGGRLMWRQAADTDTTSPARLLTLSLLDFPAGLYFVTLRSEGQTVTKPLVVQRP